MASSFRYMYFLGCANVSVGQAANWYGDDAPVGALMRSNTRSAERTAAAPPLVMPVAKAFPTLNSVWPALASCSFPPTWSASALVSITYRMGLGDRRLI